MDEFLFTCLQPSIYLIVPRNSVQTSKIQNLLNQNYFNSNLPILKNMKYKISSKFVNKKSKLYINDGQMARIFLIFPFISEGLYYSN